MCEKDLEVENVLISLTPAELSLIKSLLIMGFHVWNRTANDPAQQDVSPSFARETAQRCRELNNKF